jgi:hypothetical protein
MTQTILSKRPKEYFEVPTLHTISTLNQCSQHPTCSCGLDHDYSPIVRNRLGILTGCARLAKKETGAIPSA